MHTKRFTMTALSGAMIALAACGGGGDDDTADPGTTIDIAGESPGDDTAPADDGGTGDGSGCPVLSDADAAQALGVEKLTFTGSSTLCTWQTPDGEVALGVFLDEPSDPGSPSEQAKSAGINECGMSEPRSVEVAGGAAIVCDAGLGIQGIAFSREQRYSIQVGDPYANPDDAEMAERIDSAAKVIAKLTLPDG